MSPGEHAKESRLLQQTPYAERPGGWSEVMVATTWRCNLRCSYCFLDVTTGAIDSSPMSPELAACVIDSLEAGLPDVAEICVHLYGGEPLTNLAAAEAMLARAEQSGGRRFTWAITTNGTILNDAVVDLLGRGDFRVVLSIDGPPQIHDACRKTADGRSTHARVMDFLSALKTRTTCRVRGSAVVRRGWTLSEAEAYLRALPVDLIKAQAVRRPTGDPLALSPGDRDICFQDLEAVGRTVIADLESGKMPRDDRFNSRALQLFCGLDREDFCPAGRTNFGVTPKAEVLPCVLLDTPRNLLGHVREDPRAWREAGRKWVASRPYRPGCQNCQALPLCGGGCAALLDVCGTEECDLVRKNCEVATTIYKHFRSDPEPLLLLAGIS